MIIVFLDTETSGTDPNKHEIIQIGAVACDFSLRDWLLPDTLELKLQFSLSDANPDALEMNSYDQELWEKEALDPRKAHRIFQSWLNRYRTETKISARTGNPYQVARIGGHRADFDRKFIDQWYDDMGMFCPIDYLCLDTLQLALWFEHAYPTRTSPDDFKLTTLCEYYGLDLSDAHDALADATASAYLAHTLLQRVGV
jgi:DNA polymerase-3 subunit epsilon